MNINLRIEVTQSTAKWEDICELLRAGVTIKYDAMFLVRNHEIREIYKLRTLDDNETCIFTYLDSGRDDTGRPTDNFFCVENVAIIPYF